MREISNSYAVLAQMICDTLLRDGDFRRLLCCDSPDTLSQDAPTEEEARALIAEPEPFAADGRRIFFQELLPTVTESRTSFLIWVPGMAEVARVSDGRERCGYDITLETSW